MKYRILFIIIFVLSVAVWVSYSYLMEEETNEEYCESIYWEDEDNCIYFEPGVFTGTPEFCDKIIFESTRKACFKAIKQNKQRKK